MSSTAAQTQFGSKWWKIDFHVHTPASSDYGHGDQSVRNTTTPEIILRAAMLQQLDAIVVADHNSSGWIDQLQLANKNLQTATEKPAWYRELVIFPGVEISVSGGQDRIHVLAVFEPGVCGNTIAGLLGRCGIFSDYGNAQTTTTTSSITDTIRHIFAVQAIPILAHVDAPKGYLHNISCLPDGGKLFKGEHRVYAAEFADIHAFDAHPSDVKNVVDSLAQVRGSDAHSPDGIGRFSSWLKMSSPSMASMRLALQSPEWSVKNQTDNPNQKSDLVLQQLTITDMKHCGRIKDKPCVMFFNPHQTSLIGGRGSGKSTVIESLRIALAKEKIDDTPDSRVQKRIDSFMEQTYGRKKGVMLETTAIELRLQRNNDVFKVVWNANGARHTIQKLQGAAWVEEQGNLPERFPVIVLSQKQIEELADNPHGLLGVIDRYIKKGEWDRQWEQNRAKFNQLREKARDLRRKLNEESSLKAQLEDVESDLAQFEKRGDGEILKRYQHRQLQWNAVWEDDIFEVLATNVRTTAQQFTLPPFQGQLFDKTDISMAEQSALHDFVSNELLKIRDVLLGAANTLDTLRETWEQQLNNSAFSQDFALVTKQYQTLAAEYEKKNSRLDMSLYEGWTNQRNSLLAQLKQMEPIKRELEGIEKQIAQVSCNFEKLRADLVVLRRQFIEEAIGGNPYVKMTIIPYGDIADLENEYRTCLALEAGTFRDAVLSEDRKNGILAELAQWEDLGGDSELLPNLIATMKRQTMSIVEGTANADMRFVKRLKAEMLQRPQSFDNLLSWFPEDGLRVQYAKNDSSGKFTDLERGSAGQKAAAILAFLLSYGKDPIIIDQPEDDLENALVYNLVVKQLHESKNRRQVIVATHNPNIVVNGDSELVHVCSFEGGQVTIAHSGGLDNKEIRDDICAIMEGGKEAFERRYKRMELGNG